MVSLYDDKHTNSLLIKEIFSDKLEFVDTGMDNVDMTYNCVKKLATSNILQHNVNLCFTSHHLNIIKNIDLSKISYCP
jgi:hypothetical protein